MRRKRAQVESFAQALTALLPSLHTRSTQPHSAPAHIQTSLHGFIQPDNEPVASTAALQDTHANTTHSQGSAMHVQQAMAPVTSSAQVRVVDFGSGSGNLLLPLAYAFPTVQFHAVDCKRESVERLLRRAEEAGLGNVTAEVARIEEYTGGMSLHAALVAHHELPACNTQMRTWWHID